MHVINLDESSQSRIVLFLVKNIKGIQELRTKVLTGELDCCVVKPTLILDPLQIAVAANKAALSQKFGKLTTKSINSELLYNLSISKNITQSLTKFGIDEDSKNVLVVVFEQGDEKKAEVMKSEIVGDFCDVKEISQLSDIDLISKTYKIKDGELQVSALIDSVTSRIATKDFGSY